MTNKVPYCPRCALPMKVDGETISCSNAMDPLSIKDTELLLKWIESLPEHRAFPYQVGGNWNCPACGSPCIEREKGLVVCTRCDRCLTPLLGMFVERFVHR